MRLSFVITHSLLALACVNPAAVCAVEQTVTLEEVRGTAIQNSPEAAEIGAQRLSAIAQASELTRRENPQLDLELRPVISGGSGSEPEVELSVAQPIRVGSLGARRAVAQLIEDSAQLDQKLRLHELSQEIRLLYGKCVLYQEREKQLLQMLAGLDTEFEASRRNSQSGLIPKSAVAALEAQIATYRIAVRTGRADRARALAELQRKSGLILQNAMLAPLPETPLPDFQSLPRDSAIPLQERAQLRAKLAAAQLERARRDAVPQLAPRVGYERTSDQTDLLKVGIAFDLPVFGQNQTAVAETAAELQAAQRAEQCAGEVFEAEIEQVYTALRETLSEQTEYREKILPLWAKALKASRAELTAGQASTIQHFALISEFVASHSRYTELAAKALNERVELSILLGTEL